MARAAEAIARVFEPLCPLSAVTKLAETDEIAGKMAFFDFQNDFQKILLTDLRPMRENENRPVAAQDSASVGRYLPS